MSKEKWNLKLLGGCILILALFIISIRANTTYSYFHASAEIQNNIFRAAAISDYLIIDHGKAKATFPAAGDPSGESRPVATYKNDQMTLDFGEVSQGSSENFSEVLLLKNISDQNISVSWELKGDIKDVFSKTNTSFSLLPEGEENNIVNKNIYESPYQLNMKLDIDVKCKPMTYEGNLIICVNGDFLRIELPAKVVVREKKETITSLVKDIPTKEIPVKESVYAFNKKVPETKLPEQPKVDLILEEPTSPNIDSTTMTDPPEKQSNQESISPDVPISSDSNEQPAFIIQ